MVAQTIALPNVRKMFVPDMGYMLLDIDLERADAQVVAWDADDNELKDIFRSGADIHTENAMAVFRCSREAVHVGGANSPRQRAKQGVHAANYGSSPKTLAEETNMTIEEAEFFISRWFQAHPKIKAWHERIESQLNEDRLITNAFGYRYYEFDRLPDVKRFHEALAWIPQSTVAICTNIGLANIDQDLPEVQLLIQVHDSLVMQVPIDLCPNIYPKILEQMRVVVPYDDPLTIPVNMSASTISWGDLVEVKDVPKVISKEMSERYYSSIYQIPYDQKTTYRTLSQNFETSEAMIASIIREKVWHEPQLR